MNSSIVETLESEYQCDVISRANRVGYIYCLSNESMPGLLKIGKTDRIPEDRVKELFTTGVPTPFKIEFSKKVLDCSKEEKKLHTILEIFTERLCGREFFRVTVEKVRKLFDIIDGEMLVKNDKDEKEDNYSDSLTQINEKNVKGFRKMEKIFIQGQRIRHIINKRNTWIGIYDASKNAIVCNDECYNSLSGFAKAHNIKELPHRSSHEANGWRECDCEINGNWISIEDYCEQLEIEGINTK